MFDQGIGSPLELIDRLGIPEEFKISQNKCEEKVKEASSDDLCGWIFEDSSIENKTLDPFNLPPECPKLWENWIYRTRSTINVSD